MTRRGKIARLPCGIREELNQRLENGEQGGRLLEWLNTLPEVKKVLETDFEGQAISDANLSAWRNGGFVDWQAWQRAEGMMERWPIDCGMSGKPAAAMVASLTNALTAHYAAALEDSNAILGEDPKTRVERLGRSLKDMSRLRRDELAAERLREHVRIEDVWVGIERERAELDRERLELQRARLTRGTNRTPETDAERERERHLEKAEMVKQMVREARAKLNEQEKIQGPQSSVHSHSNPE